MSRVEYIQTRPNAKIARIVGIAAILCLLLLTYTGGIKPHEKDFGILPAAFMFTGLAIGCWSFSSLLPILILFINAITNPNYAKLTSFGFWHRSFANLSGIGAIQLVLALIGGLTLGYYIGGKQRRRVEN